MQYSGMGRMNTNRQYDKGWNDHVEFLADRQKLNYVGDSWRLPAVFLFFGGFLITGDFTLLALFLPDNIQPDWPFVLKVIGLGILMMTASIPLYRQYQKKMKAAKIAFVAKWGRNPW
jgi:hypothetical protein